MPSPTTSIPARIGGRSDLWAREQLSHHRGLFLLSMLMIESLDEYEILRMALGSVSAVGRGEGLGAFLDRDGALVGAPIGSFDSDGVVTQLEGLANADGEIQLTGHPWAQALALRGATGHRGYLVIGAPSPPTDDEQFLYRVLAHQTGAALATAALVTDQRAQADAMRSMTDEIASSNERLKATVSDLVYQRRIHDKLSRVSAAGVGAVGIADAVHQLTGLPVVVEDRFGHLLAWSGPKGSKPPRSRPGTPRDDVVVSAQRAGGMARDGSRLVAVAQPRDVVLGTITLIDPTRSATDLQTFALQRGAIALAMELAHQKVLAETELRLRRDLVEDLIDGTDEESVRTRANALGIDLLLPHQVAVFTGRPAGNGDTVLRAVENVANGLGLRSVLARHSGIVVLIVQTDGELAEETWREIHNRVSRRLRLAVTSIGVGRVCTGVAEIPQSWREATRALRVRQSSSDPDGVTSYGKLGLYGLLARGDSQKEIESFVREWLGALLDYDGDHNTELVRTLARYLECGGSYDDTAEALTIHRSTVRYRLQRIREIADVDLGDVEQRLNLHVATRAWALLQDPT
jgi:sugar diacid utilization regulator